MCCAFFISLKTGSRSRWKAASIHQRNPRLVTVKGPSRETGDPAGTAREGSEPKEGLTWGTQLSQQIGELGLVVGNQSVMLSETGCVGCIRRWIIHRCG